LSDHEQSGIDFAFDGHDADGDREWNNKNERGDPRINLHHSPPGVIYKASENAPATRTGIKGLGDRGKWLLALTGAR
jgi:hypothetical protein